MCQTHSKRALMLKNRVAYKVLEQFDNHLYTLYQAYPIEMHETLKAEGNGKVHKGTIYGGYFHCYRKLNVAKNNIAYSDQKLIIVKVIIPALFNKVYIGNFHGNKDSICAQKIKIVKIVYTNKKGDNNV